MDGRNISIVTNKLLANCEIQDCERLWAIKSNVDGVIHKLCCECWYHSLKDSKKLCAKQDCTEEGILFVLLITL